MTKMIFNCSKCRTDIKTMIQLETVLKQVKGEQTSGHWNKIIQLSASLPAKELLSAKKSPKILTSDYKNQIRSGEAA